MSTNDGGPAYPCYTTDDWGHEDQWLGLSKLEAASLAAMQGDWAQPEPGAWMNHVEDEVLEARARLYYRMARAWIEVGEEESGA